MELDAIIEVPKNSKVKYEFCEKSNQIRVDRILSSAYNYPFNYGYIDKTLAEDGDKLDIVVLNDQPIFPMSIIRVKPIGVLLMRDGPNEHSLEYDPKILAYPITKVDQRYKEINDINDVSNVDKLILKDFFSNYKNNENKISIVNGFDDKNEAIKIIKDSLSAYSKNNDDF